jgi:hypothetical protein
VGALCLMSPDAMGMTRRGLIRGLLLLLGIVSVGTARRAGRRAREAAAQPVGPGPSPSPTEPLSRTELDNLLAFGEIVVEGRSLPAAERGYLASYIAERAEEASGYHRANYRTAIGLLNRLAGSPFSSLDFDQRMALVVRHHLTSSRVLPDEDLGLFPEDVRTVRTQVVPDLIRGYYRSPAGWAIVGYDTFLGRCGDLARYTGPER